MLVTPPHHMTHPLRSTQFSHRKLPLMHRRHSCTSDHYHPMRHQSGRWKRLGLSTSHPYCLQCCSRLCQHNLHNLSCGGLGRSSPCQGETRTVSDRQSQVCLRQSFATQRVYLVHHQKESCSKCSWLH